MLITSANWTARLSSRQALGQQELGSALLGLLPAVPRELLGALTSHAEKGSSQLKPVCRALPQQQMTATNS